MEIKTHTGKWTIHNNDNILICMYKILKFQILSEAKHIVLVL